VAAALFVCFAILCSAASYVLTDVSRDIQKAHAFKSLQGIGELKVGQIGTYFQERKGDALVAAKFLSNPSVMHWLVNPSGHAPAAVRQQLETALTIYRYGGVLLLDSKANIRFGSGQYTGLSEAGKSTALRTIKKNLHSTSPIYFGDPSAQDKPLLDTFVPIVNPDTSAVMGVLMLRDDLRFLFSLLQSWPVESETGETLLVTRDGGDVLFLNELRFRKDTALQLRLPIQGGVNALTVPTKEMMKGYYGALEAFDYRERSVLAYNIAVPDTSWGMVVKMDTSEVLEQVRRFQLIVWAIAAFFTLGAGIVLWMWWKKQTVERLADEQSARVAADLRISAIAFETHEAIVITDCHPKILRVNQAFQDITGYTAEEVIGRNPNILRGEKKPKAFYEEMWATIFREGKWSGEMLDKRKNGEIYPKQLTITAVTAPDGTLTHYVGSFFDITERKKAEDEINRLAFFDPLTGLPNRRLLLDRLQHALATSARSGRYGAIMFIDLDNFKIINDTEGHDCGDLLLVEIAQRLQSCVREGDTVVRLGGDEFVVMLEDLASQAEHAAAQVEEVGEKIRMVIDQPCLSEKCEFHSTASIGVSLFIGHEATAETLLKYADIAMYQAKGSGRNTVRFFDPDMQATLETRTTMESDLRRALVERQFSLYYQMQIDDGGRVFGAEALVRWIHPLRGMILPAQFIPIAEESQLILDIGQWVLETACRQIAVWANDEQKCNLVLAVNVSARQFKLADFVDKVVAAIETHRINPSRLKLELTESVVLDDLSDIVTKMRVLKTLGVGLSMDDFGTGYSSLSHLKQLPLDQLKIDRSFVRDIATNPNDAVMVKAIIDMAHNFRLNVIAEGVETEEHLAFLKRHGCMAYQGYLFSKPVPVEEFEALIGKFHRDTAVA
jgi:diguanylate cyclase (GGDEF)-like protein/PAS domain S-box-containing protein